MACVSIYHCPRGMVMWLLSRTNARMCRMHVKCVQNVSFSRCLLAGYRLYRHTTQPHLCRDIVTVVSLDDSSTRLVAASCCFLAISRPPKQGMKCEEVLFGHLNLCSRLKEQFPCGECAVSLGPDQPCYVSPDALDINVSMVLVVTCVLGHLVFFAHVVPYGPLLRGARIVCLCAYGGDSNLNEFALQFCFCQNAQFEYRVVVLIRVC